MAEAAGDELLELQTAELMELAMEWFDHARGEGVAAGDQVRRLIDELAWCAMSAAEPAEIELALQWVLFNPESWFNQRRKQRERQ